MHGEEEVVAWKNLGDEYARKEQYEEALNCYQHAITLDPEFIPAWNNIGYSLVKLGRNEEAAAIRERIEDIVKRIERSAEKRAEHYLKPKKKQALRGYGQLLLLIIIVGAFLFITLNLLPGITSSGSPPAAPASPSGSPAASPPEPTQLQQDTPATTPSTPRPTSSLPPRPSTVRTTPTIIPTPLTQTARNIEVLQNILTSYHSTHTYYGPDIYVCGDMASDVWNMVETQGIKAILTVGNVDTSVSSIEDANHVWVLAEVSPNSWVALETTGGYMVCDDRTTCPVSNQLYYYGWDFDNPRELKEALENLRHPCPSGYVLGSDQLCHQACGGAYYCTGDTICVNGRCMGCDPGYILGDDLRCYRECPAGSGMYCQYGVCGDDGMCHY